MTQRSTSAAERQIVSPVRGVERIGEIIALARTRGHTLVSIAADSGVDLSTIRGWIEDGKEPSFSKAMSVIAVCGERAVNKSIALIGYGGATPLDEPNTLQPMTIAANAMSHLAVIAMAAADGRIDHTEMAPCREAADHIIAEVLPLSTAGRAE